jgi:hypothetical protein
MNNAAADGTKHPTTLLSAFVAFQLVHMDSHSTAAISSVCFFFFFHHG